jgi:hypothetical protein
MKNKQLNTKGFGLVGILAVVVVVALVGFSGWLVWHKNHEAKKTNSASNSKSTGSKSPTTTGRGSTATTDPYEGWKTYTDSQYHYSFKYPSNWSLTSGDTGDRVSANLVSPNGTVYVDYTNTFVKDGDKLDFFVSSVDDVASLPSVKVLGGMFTSQNSPRYYVVDNSQTADLEVGAVGQVVNTARFAEGSGNDAQFVAHYSGTAYSSTEAAKAWFSTEDAKTSLLILKSLSYENQ